MLQTSMEKYVFPRFGINYNTFLRYIKTDVDKLLGQAEKQKKKHVLAYTNRPICKRNRRSSSVISHSGQLIPDESQHESFERFRGWMSDWRPPADGMLPAEKDRQPDATKKRVPCGRRNGARISRYQGHRCNNLVASDPHTGRKRYRLPYLSFSMALYSRIR